MEKIGLKYGLLTAAGLIAYFLLMRLVGLTHIVELRFLNGIIMAIGITMAIRALKIKEKGNIGYFSGIACGTITAIVGTTIFAALMLVYLKIGGQSLVEVLSADRYFGEHVQSTPGVVVFSVLMLEGVISGVLISFIAMQYFKQKDHKVPNSP
ncbi:hypothetical protein ABID22_001703 [Pontibacter aydingkolensis]|uniref:DUF4199 domain-containing protein n=1 Tax=Pontibacter aydingkolensis TaxID=1911536 RepID=A0ABS7CUC7_9BACT|nr:DUF4199 domain-containing protein [Pontibacter aydingkolensis]MBW7467368.1 DUF4199 domain-containing protein [Pontibacter aydingkolensis]